MSSTVIKKTADKKDWGEMTGGKNTRINSNKLPKKNSRIRKLLNRFEKV